VFAEDRDIMIEEYGEVGDGEGTLEMCAGGWFKLSFEEETIWCLSLNQ